VIAQIPACGLCAVITFLRLPLFHRLVLKDSEGIDSSLSDRPIGGCTICTKLACGPGLPRPRASAVWSDGKRVHSTLARQSWWLKSNACYRQAMYGR
jgi:hypothetical protein